MHLHARRAGADHEHRVRGRRQSDQASLCVAVSPEPGHRRAATRPATRADDGALAGNAARAALRREVRASTNACGARVLDTVTAAASSWRRERDCSRTCCVDRPRATRERSRCIVERRLADRDAVAAEVARVPDERAACASVRTGTGPSTPPSRRTPRATSVVRAPRSPARKAATSPAGPAPTTATSTTTSQRSGAPPKSLTCAAPPASAARAAPAESRIHRRA